jgi:hypothetical protein
MAAFNHLEIAQALIVSFPCRVLSLARRTCAIGVHTVGIASRSLL